MSLADKIKNAALYLALAGSLASCAPESSLLRGVSITDGRSTISYQGGNINHFSTVVKEVQDGERTYIAYNLRGTGSDFLIKSWDNPSVGKDTLVEIFSHDYNNDREVDFIELTRSYYMVFSGEKKLIKKIPVRLYRGSGHLEDLLTKSGYEIEGHSKPNGDRSETGILEYNELLNKGRIIPADSKLIKNMFQKSDSIYSGILQILRDSASDFATIPHILDKQSENIRTLIGVSPEEILIM